MVTVSHDATVADIPGMLKDIGISDVQVYDATKQFAAQQIQECPGIEAYDLQDGLSFYAAGYGDALNRA